MNKLSQWWNKIPLPTKLAIVLLPSVVIGTIALMIILNSSSLHASFLNKDNDVTGWGSLLMGSAIGIYITFAILIYSDDSQKKISNIIIKQNERDEKRENYAITMLRFETSFVETWVQIIVQASADYWHIALDRSGTSNTQNKMANLGIFQWHDKEREKIFRNLESILGFSNDVLKPEIITLIDKLIRIIRNPIVEGDPPYPTVMVLQVEWSEPISQLISELKKELKL